MKRDFSPIINPNINFVNYFFTSRHFNNNKIHIEISYLVTYRSLSTLKVTCKPEGIFCECKFVDNLNLKKIDIQNTLVKIEYENQNWTIQYRKVAHVKQFYRSDEYSCK